MLIDVTVKIDDTRVNDLYAVIIKEGLTQPQAEPEPAPKRAPWTEGDVPLATSIWQRMQPGPRQVFSVLLDAPGKKFTSEELISAANVAGGRVFAAALTWPGKFCRDAGRELFWHFADGQYWIEPGVATIFVKARSAAGNS